MRGDIVARGEIGYVTGRNFDELEGAMLKRAEEFFRGSSAGIQFGLEDVGPFIEAGDGTVPIYQGTVVFQVVEP